MSAPADRDRIRAMRLAALQANTQSNESPSSQSQNRTADHVTQRPANQTPPPQSRSAPSQNTPTRTGPLQPTQSSTAPSQSKAPPREPPQSNIHTLASLQSRGGVKTATSCRTQTVTESHELYVGLPSFSVTREQFEEYVRVQFGVDIVVRFMNEKKKVSGRERNFCFIECKNREDMDYLLEELHDSTIGDWDDPIQCFEKKERDQS